MLQFKIFKKHKHLIHGVFDKKYGNLSLNYSTKSAVNKRLTITAKALGIDPQTIVTVNQIHSEKIIVISKDSQLKRLQLKPKSADGLITNLKNVSLLIKTADCIPLFLYDPKRNVCGLIHVGWRGADLSIHLKALMLFKLQFNSKPQSILAGLGPSICGSCYAFTSKPKQAGSKKWQEFIFFKKNLWHIDIEGFVIHQLVQFGVQKSNIESLSECTMENTRMFSYKRSKKTGEPEGRFGSILGIRS